MTWIALRLAGYLGLYKFSASRQGLKLSGSPVRPKFWAVPALVGVACSCLWQALIHAISSLIWVDSGFAASWRNPSHTTFQLRKLRLER